VHKTPVFEANRLHFSYGRQKVLDNISLTLEAGNFYAIISGALGTKKLRDVIDHTDRVVMLKVYREYKEIMDVLDQLDLLKGSVLVSRCGLDGERIVRNLEDGIDSVPPYLSLLLISKRGRWK